MLAPTVMLQLLPNGRLVSHQGGVEHIHSPLNKKSYVDSLTEKVGHTPDGLLQQSDAHKNNKSATYNTLPVTPQLQDVAISRGQHIIQAKKQSCSTESFPYLTTQSVDVLPWPHKRSGELASPVCMHQQSSMPMECFLPNVNTTVDSLPNILEHCKCEERGIPNMVHMPKMFHMPNTTLDSLPGIASGTLDSLPNFNEGFAFEAMTVTSDSLPIINDRSVPDERGRSMTMESLPTVFESDDPVKRRQATLESLPEVSEKTNMGLSSLGTLEEAPQVYEAAWQHPLMKAPAGIPGSSQFEEQSKHNMQSAGMRLRHCSKFGRMPTTKVQLWTPPLCQTTGCSRCKGQRYPRLKHRVTFEVHCGLLLHQSRQ